MLCGLLRIGLLFAILSLGVRGAGVTTHLTYVTRVASEKFDDYYPWLKAGAFFPDSLYSCKPSKQLSEFAEATHWPPFLMSGLKLWQERYGSIPSKKYSQDSVRLQAFLTGVFSHQIVDSSWHSLVDGFRSHGLLRVLAETEFHGQIDDAHDFLDTIGDFIGLSNIFSDITDLNWKYYVNSNWTIPKEEDMTELLSRNGLSPGKISYKELEVCVSRGLSASVSETFVMLSRRHEVLSLAYKISPASRDIMQEYWLGGEFDLISMLQKCLPVYQNLFDTNSLDQNSIRQIQLCGNLPNTLSSSHGALRIDTNQDVSIVRPVTSLSNFGTSIALGQFKSDGKLYMAVSAPTQNSEGCVYLILFSQVSSRTDSAAVMEPFTPMRGSTVHTFSTHGVDFLVISEPGSNSIHFYHGGRRYLTIRDRMTSDAFQLQLYAVADIDGDSEPDLLLSGPYYGKNETGRAIVIPGIELVRYLRLSSTNNTDVDISSLSIVSLNGGPYNRAYQHFGAAMAASHLYSGKGFLYVTCQSLGAVFVYPLFGLQPSSLPKYVMTHKGLLTPEEEPPIDIKVIPSAVHGMFGKGLLSFGYKGNNYLAISQHLFNYVFIYREDDYLPKFLLKIRLEDDQQTAAWSIGFGTAIAYDVRSETLHISSPGSFDNKGAIWKISMQELLAAAEAWKTDTFYVHVVNHLDLVNPWDETKGFSNFGKVLQIAPNKSVIIGAPQYGNGNLHDKQLTGAVFVR